MEQGPMRIDLHVHSKFSTRPSQWILQKLGCPESFTEPHEIYQIAKTRGMTLVTITDHNRIEGALAGAAGGGLMGALVGWGVSDKHILKYEEHLIEVRSLIPGRFLWDYIRFEPY